MTPPLIATIISLCLALPSVVCRQRFRFRARGRSDARARCQLAVGVATPKTRKKVRLRQGLSPCYRRLGAAFAPRHPPKIVESTPRRRRRKGTKVEQSEITQLPFKSHRALAPCDLKHSGSV
ncbi:hypothetical protein BHE74_00052216 [Ensete ventricosum]|nr:hypothetical protein BHE74_00052216 [Ensete ventricosum]